jgi:hypothetical protein
MGNIVEWLEIIAVVVGGASMIVLGLEKIAGVTPSTKDDEYVGKAKKVLGKVSEILSRLALNPKDK